MTIDSTTISAVTALVAVVVSPFVSVYVAKRHIRAAVVSANRQAWINQLREALAELVTGLRFLNLRSQGLDAQEQWVERYQRTFHLTSKIALLLNLAEADHKELHATIKQAGELLAGTVDDEKLFAVTDRILELSQAILKREWERVKRGD